jgi:AraC-like DNA-binding protein
MPSMKRARELFVFEERGADVASVEKLWRTRGEPAEAFISVAVSRWEMVVTRQRDRTTLTIRGPETRATIAPIPQDAEFFGVQFRLGAFMPHLPVDRLVDGALTLSVAGERSFWLNGAAWELPSFDNADAFVARLERARLLVRDPVVEAALAGRPVDLSARSVERRVRRATGLTRTAIRQIGRAERAVELLSHGASIPETVRRAGYADQAHLTRSLRRFVGQTPSRVLAGRAG